MMMIKKMHGFAVLNPWRCVNWRHSYVCLERRGWISATSCCEGSGVRTCEKETWTWSHSTTTGRTWEVFSARIGYFSCWRLHHRGPCSHRKYRYVKERSQIVDSVVFLLLGSETKTATTSACLREHSGEWSSSLRASFMEYLLVGTTSCTPTIADDRSWWSKHNSLSPLHLLIFRSFL